MNDASAADINALKILVSDKTDKHRLLLQKYSESTVVGVEQIKMALRFEISLLVSRVHRLYGKVEIHIDNFYSRDIQVKLTIGHLKLFRVLGRNLGTS